MGYFEKIKQKWQSESCHATPIILIWISLITNEVGHIFMCLFAIDISSFVKFLLFYIAVSLLLTDSESFKIFFQ